MHFRFESKRDNVNHEGQADNAIRFVSDDSTEGKEIHNVLVKNKQYKKLTQKQLTDILKKKGFKKFTTNSHQLFWQTKWKDAPTRNTQATEYGELVIKNQWLWYEEKWFPIVLEHCQNNNGKYQ